MNMHTKMSEKGQVVVPKAIRDRLGFTPGTELEAIETGDGVLLRRPVRRKTITMEEAKARLRQIYVHKRPPVSLEEMDEAIRKGRQETVKRRFGDGA